MVSKIDSFFLFIDSSLREATNDASLLCLSWMSYFSRAIFYLITKASLYLPSLTSRFFLSSSSVSFVDVSIEYRRREVCTKRLSSCYNDLFLKSIVWWILYFVLLLNYPMYSFHYFSNIWNCSIWFISISARVFLLSIYNLVVCLSISLLVISLIRLSISFAYKRPCYSSPFKQLFLNSDKTFMNWQT